MSETRQLPAQEPRVETGNVKFGDDWTGVFIRGDNAFQFAFGLQRVLDRIEAEPVGADTVNALFLHGLLEILEGSNESKQ